MVQQSNKTDVPRKEVQTLPYGGRDCGFYSGSKIVLPFPSDLSLKNLESYVGRGDLVCLTIQDSDTNLQSVQCLHFFGISSGGAEFRHGLPYNLNNPGFFVDLASSRVVGSNKLLLTRYELIKRIGDFDVPYNYQEPIEFDNNLTIL